ncbi:unnamed protein product [Dicrocoelium dendriticum]|nr:unnamed protein product [Dicrocoelium dendriticum]
MCPSSGLLSLAQSQRVRSLYKTILKLHRALPSQLAEFGNRYVREEFRKHKDKPEFMDRFLFEWSNYAIELAKQVRDLPRNQSSVKGTCPPIGKAIQESNLDHFSDAQLHQLLILAEEIRSVASQCHKPSDQPNVTQ